LDPLLIWLANFSEVQNNQSASSQKIHSVSEHKKTVEFIKHERKLYPNFMCSDRS